MLFSIEKIKGNLHFIKNKEGKGYIFNLKNKKPLFNESFDILIELDDFNVGGYYLVKKNGKEALLHLKKGIVTAWFDDIITTRRFYYTKKSALKKFLKNKYLLAMERVDNKSKKAFFKFDGTRITDYYDDIVSVGLTKDDILYIAFVVKKGNALFSLKRGRLTDWFDGGFPFPEDVYNENVNYFIASRNEKRFLLSKKTYQIVSEGKNMFPVYYSHNKNNEVYWIEKDNNKGFLFYQGYTTDYYDFITSISPNPIFLAVRKSSAKKKFCLIDLKNKICQKMSDFLFKNRNIWLEVIKDCLLNLTRLNYIPSFIEVKYNYESEKYCPSCNNIWVVYFKYKNTEICPLCEANKLEAFIL
jgi:hypothetical protein